MSAIDFKREHFFKQETYKELFYGKKSFIQASLPNTGYQAR
jgi:hypothetical protein